MLIVFFRPFRRRWVPWCGGGGREGQWEVYAEVYAVEGWERHKQKGWSCVCASGVRAFPSEILIFICSPTIDVEQLVCSSQRDAWRPGAGGGVWCRVKEACSWARVVMAAMERVLWVWTVGRRSGMWGSRGRGGELYDYGASPGACMVTRGVRSAARLEADAGTRGKR